VSPMREVWEGSTRNPPRFDQTRRIVGKDWTAKRLIRDGSITGAASVQVMRLVRFMMRRALAPQNQSGLKPPLWTEGTARAGGTRRRWQARRRAGSKSRAFSSRMHMRRALTHRMGGSPASIRVNYREPKRRCR